MASGKYFIQMPQATRKIPRYVEQENAVLRRHRLIQVVKGHRGQAVKGGINDRLHSCRARQSFQNAHLAEKITRTQFSKFDFVRLTKTSAHTNSSSLSLHKSIPSSACPQQE